MKYIRYQSNHMESVDLFSVLINHDERAANISKSCGPVEILSAGKFRFDDETLDGIIADPGSPTLGIEGGDAIADAKAIKLQMRFF